MRAEKQLLLDEIKDKIDVAKAIIITKYSCLPPNLSWNFRDRLAKAGCLFEVVRKRVFLKAAELSGLTLDASLFQGHVGIVFVEQVDLTSSAKVIFKFSEENQNILSVICGHAEGKIISGVDVEQLSKLPGINEMRAELLALFIAPMTHTLSVVEAVMDQTVSVVDQKSQQ